MQNAECRMQQAQALSRSGRVEHVALFTPILRVILSVHFAFCMLHSDAAAQQLLDRIVARVGGSAITLSELVAARGFGIVEGTTDEAVLQRMIDRQLLLIEVARFPPQEPTDAAIAAEVARERVAAGSGLADLMVTTG